MRGQEVSPGLRGSSVEFSSIYAPYKIRQIEGDSIIEETWQKMRWQDKTCCICGVGSKVYIEISIALPDDSEYPYTQTALCKECWDEYGISVAFEHNKEIQGE